MTATVRKGTNRPAATAKSARHAQRTPLPPKREDVEAAFEAVAEWVEDGAKTKAADAKRLTRREETAAQNVRREAFATAHNTLGWSKGMSLTGKLHWATLETRGTGQDGYRHLNQICGATGARAYASLDFVAETRLDDAVVDCKRCVAAMAARERAQAEKAAAAELTELMETQEAARAADGYCTRKLDCVRPVDHKGRCGARTKAEQDQREKQSGMINAVVEGDEPDVDTEGDAPESPAPQPQKRAKKAPSSNAADATAGTPADTKAHRYAAHADFSGWECKVQTDGDYAELIARRGSETMHLHWVAGVYQHPATYAIADRTMHIRNAAEARRWAQRSPEAAETELARVGANKAFRRREVEPQRSKLPFDLEAPDAFVVESLVGRKVRWHNRFTQTPEVARVGRDLEKVRLVHHKGERVFLFCSPEFGGFRAFRLSALVSVSK